MNAMPLVKGAGRLFGYIAGSAALFFLALFVGFTVWEASTGSHETFNSPDGAYSAVLRIHPTDRGDQVAVAVGPRHFPFPHTVYRATTKVHRANTRFSLLWSGSRELTIRCEGCNNFKVVDHQSVWHNVHITLAVEP